MYCSIYTICTKRIIAIISYTSYIICVYIDARDLKFSLCECRVCDISLYKYILFHIYDFFLVHSNFIYSKLLFMHCMHEYTIGRTSNSFLRLLLNCSFFLFFLIFTLVLISNLLVLRHLPFNRSIKNICHILRIIIYLFIYMYTLNMYINSYRRERNLTHPDLHQFSTQSSFCVFVFHFLF